MSHLKLSHLKLLKAIQLHICLEGLFLDPSSQSAVSACNWTSKWEQWLNRMDLVKSVSW